MSGSPTPEERSAHLHAISTRQAALIGLVGVLVAAFLSVLAAVISARLAGEAAARTTALQLSGETARSRAEFLRGERRVLYARVVAHVRMVDVQMDHYTQSIESNKVTKQQALSYVQHRGPVGFSTMHVPGDKEMVTLDNDRAELAILASTPVIRAFDNLFEAENMRSISLTDCTYNIANSAQPDEESLNKAIFSDPDRINDAVSKMLDSMKVDMGAQ
jgi:hypothetical protein